MMEKYEVVWTDDARDNFRQILKSMRDEGFDASGWANGMFQAVTKLEYQPDARQVKGYDSSGEAIRSLVVGTHCLYYSVDQDQMIVTVLYLVHGSRITHPKWLRLHDSD